jgi:hypothetical protein
MKILALLILLFLQPPQVAVPPLNSVGVATGCDNQTIQCTYTDANVPPGPHFYFVVASNSAGYSGPSNVVNVTVPSGTHSVTLTWQPSTGGNPAPSYFIYRGAPATNVQITGEN